MAKRPIDLGFPDKFKEWRSGQWEAVKKILFSDGRYVALVSPTGAGKSLTYLSYGLVNEDLKGAVITATKVLQDQIASAFDSIGVVDIRGRANYVCDIEEDGETMADEGICVYGHFCVNSQVGPCHYYDQKRKAENSRLLLTNYAYWLEHPDLNDYDFLIFDEAHKAADEVSRFAMVEVSETQLKRLSLKPPPMHGTKSGIDWALATVEEMGQRKLTKQGSNESMKLASKLERKLARLCRLSGQAWIRSASWSRASYNPVKVYRWDLLDPSKLAPSMLFRGASKVILSSASMRMKTLRMLGVEGARGKEITMVEQPSIFPIKRRPIYYWPIARFNKAISWEKEQEVYEAMDSIIDARLDRKGVVHCVSYERGLRIWQQSRHQGRMLLHEQGKQTPAQIVDQFRNSPQGTILVSPAVVEGVDLAYQDCEYAILVKVPYPALFDPLMQARMQADQTYLAYLAIQAMVQAVGRHMRADDDQGETFILDAGYGWLRTKHRDFAPGWFYQSMRDLKHEDKAPAPPPSLNDQDPERFPHRVWSERLKS